MQITDRKFWLQIMSCGYTKSPGLQNRQACSRTGLTGTREN